MTDLDILVIGAGTAGQTAALDLIMEGYSVAVVEKSKTPGGICALHGCQAKKWFYELTELVAKSNHLKGLGITSGPAVSWEQVLQAKNSFTSQIPSNTILNLKGNTIEYLEGDAVFTDADTVLVENTPLKPRFVVVATGAKPMDLPIKGGEHMVTSNDFLGLEKLPRRITLIGGGFISFEFAHFAARLGAIPEEIHILEVMDRVLGPFDKDIVEQLVAATRAEGIKVHTGISIEAISKESSGFTVTLASGECIETDLVVHGAGRVPDIDSLGLEAAGITFNNRGIEVDGHMQSSNPKVFAVGDCAATVQLARVADREAHQAALAITSLDAQESIPELDYQVVPAVLFTYPQLGMVGKTEEELIAEGTKYWKSNDKELSWPTYRRIGMKNGAYKILIDSDSKILGAHILSDNATGMINTFKQAMLDDVSVAELHQANIMSPYPSRESDIIYMLDSLLD